MQPSRQRGLQEGRTYFNESHLRLSGDLPDMQQIRQLRALQQHKHIRKNRAHAQRFMSPQMVTTAPLNQSTELPVSSLSKIKEGLAMVEGINFVC